MQDGYSSNFERQTMSMRQYFNVASAIIPIILARLWSYAGPILHKVIKHAVEASSDRQLRVPPATHPESVYHETYVWPDDGCTPRKGGDGAKEVAKQHHDAVQLDTEADQGPPQQYEGQPAKEGRRALCLLFPRKEEQGLLRPDYYGESDQEEDLFVRRRGEVRLQVSGTVTARFGGFRGGGSHTFPIASLAGFQRSAKQRLICAGGGRCPCDNSHGPVKEHHHSSYQEEATYPAVSRCDRANNSSAIWG